MKNDLNVFEIMGNSESEDGQEQEASDLSFHEAIKDAMSGIDDRPGDENTVKGESKRHFKQDWKGLALEAGIAIIAVLLIFNFVINVSRISGNSMMPGFCDGDRIVINRLDRTYENGDIVVFKAGMGDKLIKRIIASEGDVVDISAQGGLYINGKAVSEDYVYTITAITDERVQYPVSVGKDQFFVLGDNRTNSKDSRKKEIGLVKKQDIVGSVILSIRNF